MSTHVRVDLVVLGDGIIGLSIANEAQQRGLTVVVVATAKEGAATPAAGGMLTPNFEVESANHPLQALAQHSCKLYPDFIEQIEATSGIRTGYEKHGTLLVALHRDHIAELQQIARQQATLGIKTEWLTKTATQQLEPELNPRLHGALYAKDDHRVDPRRLHRALERSFEMGGGQQLKEASLLDLQTTHSQSHLVIATQTGTIKIETRMVLAAAGTWTNQLMPELSSLPMRPIKGQFIRLRGAAPCKRVVRTPDVYLIPQNGGLYVGATSEDVGFEEGTTAGALFDLLNRGRRAIPGIHEMHVDEMGYGFRPALLDNYPIIGPTKTNGRYVAAGHYRHGIMLAPATAQLTVDMLIEQRIPDLIKPFSLSRFHSLKVVETAHDNHT